MNHIQQQNQPKLFTTIKSYWFLIIVVVGVIISWANLQNADARAAERITAIEKQHIELGAVQTQIQVQLSQIQTDLSWIRTRIGKVQ
jgi:peptidoglycan hydrolase CwlO-like protein